MNFIKYSKNISNTTKKNMTVIRWWTLPEKRPMWKSSDMKKSSLLSHKVQYEQCCNGRIYRISICFLFRGSGKLCGFFVCLFLVFSFNDMESSPLQNLAIQDVVHELGNVLEMSSCRFFHRPIKSEFTYSQNSWWVNDILSFRSFSTTSQHCNSVVVEKQIMAWERTWGYLPLVTAPVQICVGSKQVCGKTSVKEEKNTVGCPPSLLPRVWKRVMLGEKRFKGWWDTFMALAEATDFLILVALYF